MVTATKTRKSAEKKTRTKTPKRTGQTCPKCRGPATKNRDKIRCEACNETFTVRILRRDVFEDRTGRQQHREIKRGYFDQKGKRVDKDFFEQHWSEKKQDWDRGIPDGFEVYLWHVRKLLLAPQEEWIVFAEGVKCAESMENLEYTATTNLFGGRAWHSQWYNEDLRDRRVAFFCDRDKTGEEGREKIATELHGITAETRLIYLDGDLPEKTDVTDLIEDHKWERKDFDDLIDKTPAFVPKETGSRLIVKRLSDVKSVPVQWLWYPRFALGKVSLLVGNPGVGKSFASLDMVSRISTGVLWPDGESLPEGSNRAPQGSSLLLTAEDGLDDTVRPRLDKMEADCNKILAIQGSYWESKKESSDVPVDDETSRPEFFNLLRDIELLENKVKQIGDIRIIIIDPLDAYYGARADTHQNALVRAVLGSLAELAQRHHVCIVGISHLRKSSADLAMYRVMGSIGQIAAARTAWVIQPDKENKDRRRLLCLKNNLCREQSGLAFEIKDGRVEYESGIITETADEAFEDESNMGPGVQEAIQFLDDYFVDHAKPKATDILKESQKINISESTLRKAKRQMGITSIQQPEGYWIWQTAEQKPEQSGLL